MEDTTTESIPSAHHVAEQPHGVRGYTIELFQRFNADQCAVWAASLSFFVLLSFVPLLVGGFALVGLLIRDPHQAAEQVQGLVAKFLPLSNPTEAARKLIVSAGVEQQAERLRQTSGWAGIIGLVSFLFTASRIYVNAAAPMNVAFRAKEDRNLVQINLMALGLLLGTSVLFLCSLLPSAGSHLIRQISLFSRFPEPPPLWLNAILVIVGIVLNAFSFAVIYRFLPAPSAKVSWRMAFVGGSFVAVLFEIMRQGFALYLRNFGGGNSYDKAYGSLGAVAIFLLWVHLSSQLLLLGAEVARLYADSKEWHNRHLESNRTNTSTLIKTDRMQPDGRYAQEGKTGWVSKKVSSSQGRMVDTIVGAALVGVMYLVSFVRRHSSSGRRSS